MGHFAFTLLAALVVSVVLALLGQRSPRERISAGVYVFLCCALGTVAASWGMYLIHG